MHDPSTFHPYYETEVYANNDEKSEEEEVVEAIKLTRKKPKKFKNLKLNKASLNLKLVAFVKPKFESYTYNENKAAKILNDLIALKLIKNNFGAYPKLES